MCTDKRDKTHDKTNCFIVGLYLAEREGFEPSKGVSTDFTRTSANGIMKKQVFGSERSFS